MTAILAGLARGQGGSPSEAFQRGVQCFQRAAYGEALEAFTTAHRLAPRFPVLFNIALSERALGRDVEAAAMFRRYLAEGGAAVPAERRSYVERELVAIDARVGHLDVRTGKTPAEIAVDGGVTEVASPPRLEVAPIAAEPRIEPQPIAATPRELPRRATSVSTRPAPRVPAWYRDRPGMVFFGIGSGALAVGIGLLAAGAALQDGSFAAADLAAGRRDFDLGHRELVAGGVVAGVGLVMLTAAAIRFGTRATAARR